MMVSVVEMAILSVVEMAILSVFLSVVVVALSVLRLFGIGARA